MLGRVIQNNPFILKKVDNLFYDSKIETNIDESIIEDYFSYVSSKTDKDQFLDFLVLYCKFFGVPNSKDFKYKIHEHMKNNDINLIEALLLNFVRTNKLILN